MKINSYYIRVFFIGFWSLFVPAPKGAKVVSVHSGRPALVPLFCLRQPAASRVLTIRASKGREPYIFSEAPGAPWTQ
jgi:hypothetical protein